MLKRSLAAVVLGLAVASQAVLAQDAGTYGRDRGVQQNLDEQRYWNGLTPNYHDDDSPNYLFTA